MDHLDIIDVAAGSLGADLQVFSRQLDGARMKTGLEQNPVGNLASNFDGARAVGGDYYLWNLLIAVAHAAGGIARSAAEIKVFSSQ